MIQLKTFKIEEDKKANDFMKKNPPRSTEKQSGMIFHNGHIVVIYDDGVENPTEIIGLIRSEIEGAIKRQFIITHKMKTARIALDKVKPEGYVKGMSNSKLKELLTNQTGEKYIASEKLDAVQAQIESLEQTIIIDEHEFERIDMEKEAYKDMLKGYETGK